MRNAVEQERGRGLRLERPWATPGIGERTTSSTPGRARTSRPTRPYSEVSSVAPSSIGERVRKVQRGTTEDDAMSEPTLQRLYGDELTRLLSRAVGARHVNRRTTRWMREETWRSPGATYRPSGPGRTWLWSDLHLHHRNIMRHCDRPFESVEAMDSALLSAWEATVNPNDTIICGGDVALAGALDQVLLARLGAMPGRKVARHRQPRHRTHRGSPQRPRATRPR